MRKIGTRIWRYHAVEVDGDVRMNSRIPSSNRVCSWENWVVKVILLTSKYSNEFSIPCCMCDSFKAIVAYHLSEKLQGTHLNVFPNFFFMFVSALPHLLPFPKCGFFSSYPVHFPPQLSAPPSVPSPNQPLGQKMWQQPLEEHQWS